MSTTAFGTIGTSLVPTASATLPAQHVTSESASRPHGLASDTHPLLFVECEFL